MRFVGVALLAFASCTASSSSPDAGPSACVEGAILPGAAPVRLLTRSEYDHTIRDLLGEDARATLAFPPENVALGFDNNAEAHLVSPLLVEKYQTAAEELAARARISCSDAACADDFIAQFGRRAFRRPLSSEEATIFRALYSEAETHRGGIELVLSAMLQSPQFLYRIIELQPGETSTGVALDPYALASRLSYFLWNTMPDDALLSAAEKGALATREGLEAEARRMLEDPRAKDAARDFHRQWLQIDRLELVVKDVANLEALRASWKASLYAFLEDAIFTASDPTAAMFDSPSVWLDETLGPLYGHPELTSMTKVELPERAGLITQPALLARLAHPDQTSPIHRGIFVREKLLCQTLPAPPNDIAITAPSPDPNATTRERFAQHTADPYCGGCHSMIDPIGFGFENYDEYGRFRTTENGKPIDASGFIEGAADPAFDGAVELSKKLRADGALESCVATQWYRYAMGRGEAAPADACALESSKKIFRNSAGNFRELLIAIVLSDAFRFRPAQTLTVPGELPPDPDAGIAAIDAGSLDAGTGELGPPADPIGALEAISELGFATGWALDPNTEDYPLLVELFVDGIPGTGTYVGSQRAANPHPEHGAHGFSHMLPLVALDGLPHELFVVAYNTGAGANTILGPVTFTLGDDNRVPQGFVDTVDGDGVVTGWAVDPDTQPATISVHFYVDGPAGSGTFAGITETGISRPEINAATGYSGDLGFTFQIPMSFRDGRTHTLFAYGIDSMNGINPVLRNSPYSFRSN